ncbi:ABC transporter ATP-binding protein [Sinomonas sp. JGH33]|uniref:ABC transporter ATP-binding protein n=1 Tax=Sinomonas terricola TaxID=3110330 RepID=A0ABU5T2S1_9MICC|nr:ABC transporter ATP-binding protein [Sinomonas sp. JGH33]MEA5453837.1 ABC transporter ATP-binding protein [Sinomonas sp. JGH33]
MPQQAPAREQIPFNRSLTRLAPEVRPIVPRLVGGLVVGLTASVLAVLVPQVFRAVIDALLKPGPGASAVLWAAVVVLVMGVLEAGLTFLRRIFVIDPATNVETSMRLKLYRHLQLLPVSFHDRWGSGQLLSRAMTDLNMLRRWLAFGAIFLVISVATVGVGIAMLFTISWQLALIFLAAAVPISIYSFRFRRQFMAASRRSQDQAGDLATAVEESVHGIRVLKAFGRSGEALESFAAQAEELRDTEVTKARHLAVFSMVVTLLPELALGTGLVTGVWLAATGQITVGALAAFFGTAAAVANPVEMSGALVGMALMAKTAIDRHYEVMDQEVAIADPEKPARVGAPRGLLMFRGVRFGFDGRGGPAAERPADDGARAALHGSPAEDGAASPILRHIDLELVPGETMALVGVTGSGKSTLLQLVPRLYDVTGGAVEIDGVDIRDLPLAELRRLVSVAFEDTTLFSSSVRDNVLLGAAVREGSGAELLLDEALDVAQAQFAYSLPDGVDTRIGEEGLSLSGGQRQRIALARAIAAKPAVLVLDDPLSALDVATEERVEARLREVLADTTTLIVAHRPSTVALADRVALLRDGVIDDVGTHAELLARSEHYRYVIASLDAEPRDLDSSLDPDDTLEDLEEAR